MIESTFQCAPGIGKVTEKKLNAAGYLTWKDILEKPRPAFVPEMKWNNRNHRFIGL
jgi:nucleotidyltransferase/DNA polymerase involved in DNA repair